MNENKHLQPVSMFVFSEDFFGVQRAPDEFKGFSRFYSSSFISDHVFQSICLASNLVSCYFLILAKVGWTRSLNDRLFKVRLVLTEAITSDVPLFSSPICFCLFSS